MQNRSNPARLFRAGAVVACLGLAGTVYAQTPMAGAASAATMGPATPASAKDRDFVQKAAMGGMAEVEASQVAQEKASKDSVKAFSAKMVADHGKANDELKQIATGKGMTLPAAPDAAHQKAEAKLATMSGAGFDKAYKAQMVADHQKTVALFKKEASGGNDPELKAFATKMLPDLQEHLKMAQAL